MAEPRLFIRAAHDPEASLPSYDLPGLCAASLLQAARITYSIEPVSSTAEPIYDGVSGVSQLIRAHAPARHPDERAYLALALSRLSALVEHSLFSLPLNYTKVTRPLYSQGLPTPARFLTVAQMRLRAKERLEREGLWGLGGDVEKEEQDEWKRRRIDAGTDKDLIAASKEAHAQRKARMKQAFDELKIVEQAREILAPFAVKLGSQDYFYGEQPSTLDAIVFAHLALLLHLDLPTPTIETLLKDSFPALISHTNRMRELLFPLSDRSRWPSLCSSPKRDWSGLSPVNLAAPVRRRAGQKERDQLAKRRWTWVGVASLSFLSFAVWQGILTLPSTVSLSWIGGGSVRDEDDASEDSEGSH